MNKKAGFAIDVITGIYCFVGGVGGGILGFLSLGLPGLVVGLVGGAFLGYCLLVGSSYLKSAE